MCPYAKISADLRLKDDAAWIIARACTTAAQAKDENALGKNGI